MKTKLQTLGLCLALLVAIVTSKRHRKGQWPPEQDTENSEGVVQNYLDAWDQARVAEAQYGGEIVPDSVERERMNYFHAHLKDAGMTEAQIAELDEEIESVDNETRIELSQRSSTGGGRFKRHIKSEEEYRWTRGVIPYLFTEHLDDFHRNEIQRAHLTYERLTCLRFVPWETKDGVTTNTRLELGHHSFMKHINGGGCWSYLGKIRMRGQKISCCSGTSCIHEIGHGLGLYHEQASPDPARKWMIRIDLDRIQDDGIRNFIQPDSSIAMVGYDSGSQMHYYDYFYAKGKRPTFTKLFSELQIRTNFHYLMMEVSLAHQCDVLHCADSSLVCENDGYLTLVDGKCACQCVPGLDPDTGCTDVVSSQTSTQDFPGGSYALPQPKSGCPESWMTTGVRIHQNGGDNSVSSRYDVSGAISGAGVEQKFCVVTNSKNEDSWPAGSYCIYRVGGTCPGNFRQGFVQYDDKRGLTNSVSGDLPDGVFGENTRFEYCCRDNGFTSVPMYLPNRKPFVLIKNGKLCQQVRGMHVYDQHYTIDNSHDDGIAGYGGDDEDDHTSKSGNNFTTELCYYKPATVDCGEFIELTEESPTASFSSPNGADLECTWYIKTTEEGQIKLNFDSFNVKGETDACEDQVKINYIRPGQNPFSFCGKDMSRTIQSVNKTIVVQLSTYGKTDSAFSATVDLVLDKDLCYNAADRGMSYDGKVNFTRFFEPCIPWSEALNCNYNPATFLTPKSRTALLEGNYCRNPDFTTGIMPWCYTSADLCERNYCDPCLLGDKYDSLEKCQEMSERGFCSSPDSHIYCAKTCDKKLTPVRRAADVTCSRPPAVEDGTIVEEKIKESYQVGEQVTYKCDTSDVTDKRKCLTSGKWSAMGSVCEVCPFGWSYDSDLKICMKFFNEQLSLEAAKLSCKSNGGYMAAPKSKALNSAIHKLVSKTVWIPMSKVSDDWGWDDDGSLTMEKSTSRNSSSQNSLLTWSNWDRLEPSNHVNEDYATLRSSSGKWDDVRKSNKYSYVCARAMKESSCKDYQDSQCTLLFSQNPAICTEAHFAHTICPFTCGLCLSDLTPTCPLVTPTHGALTGQRKSLSRGQTITFTCDQGFVVKSGDALRGCQQDGSLSGEPLVCVEDCPSGWEYEESSRKCYRYFADKVTYQTASSRCKEIQGHLAMPLNKQITNRIIQVVNSPRSVWIGMDDILMEDYFMWNDGTFVVWEKWSKDEPNNLFGDQDCVTMNSWGSWYDVGCSRSYGYVCEVSIDVVQTECHVGSLPPKVQSSTDVVQLGDTVEFSCTHKYVPVGDNIRTCRIDGQLSGSDFTCLRPCPDGWVSSGLSAQCYKFFPKGFDYNASKSDCEEMGGSLAMPKSKQENDQVAWAVRKVSQSYLVWIGLTDIEKEREFVWDDGTSLQGWNNWGPGEPTPYGKYFDCVMLYSSGEWINLKCVNNGKFNGHVCQVPLEQADSVLNKQT